MSVDETHVGQRLSGFSDDAIVLVKQVDNTDWEVRQGFRYGGKTQEFEVQIGEQTDFASVPRMLVWLLPRYGAYTLPAILHDHLWRKEAPDTISYRDADATLRRAMRQKGGPFATRWVMWAAVRLGALTRKGGRRGWWKDGALVIVIAVPAIVLLLPAMLIVLVTLGVVHLLELIVYPFLWVNRQLRIRQHKPAKQVNPPKLGWKV